MTPRWKSWAGTALGVAFLLISSTAWFVMFQIETAALRRPDHAIGQYTAPLHVKGVVRYVTPQEQLWDSVAQNVFGANWLAAILFGVIVARGKGRAQRAPS